MVGAYKQTNRLGSQGVPAYLCEKIVTLIKICCLISVCRFCASQGMGELQEQEVVSESKNGVCFLSERGLTDFRFLDEHSINAVVELNVSHNQIEDFNVKELFRKLPCLRHLNVSHNKIVKLRRRMIEGLPAHASVNFSDNPITTTSKHIISVFNDLADKDITISCYNTQLPHKLLKQIESNVMRASCWHRTTYYTSMVIGSFMFAGSIPLRALADATSQNASSSCSQGMNVTINSSSCLQGQQAMHMDYLRPLSIVMFATGALIIAIQPCLQIMQHERNKSKFYWNCSV